VRDYLKTDNTYREAKVDWKLTAYLLNKFLKPVHLEEILVIVQGFIGGTTENYTTSLGREGSDFTASVFAYCLDADEVQIWKDVPGLLNADPRFFKDTVKINKTSFQETIELAYYGAKIIHPKTIKPLQNKNIPLKVKSFLNPEGEGTLICKDIKVDDLVPSFILKQDQALISISTRDFSFIAEDHLEMIFGFFAKYLVKINLMQNSAISFSVCCDNEQEKITSLINDLKKCFYLRYNKGLELITIRHYDDESIEKALKGRKVYLEQTSRSTIQMLVENE
jgi:aspartate kinase